MIYNSLSDVAEQFDLFIFDAYGVFWEGNGFYAGSRETMADLIKVGKTVVVLSNSSALGDDLRRSYHKRGLDENIHYQYLVSSGDLLRHRLKTSSLHFQTCAEPHKYYVLGQPHVKAFQEVAYQQVNTLAEADFVYIGVPYMFAPDVAAYPQYADQYWPAKADENGKITIWDTLTAAPFEKIVQEIAESGLPALNANPDFVAKEGHPLVPESNAVFVVRNGLIAEMLRQKGVEVLEFGKPHRNIYEFVFEILQKDAKMADRKRICMIGDTVRTDVKGGINAGITPILCVKTGITAQALQEGQSVEDLCQNEGIDVAKVLQINSVGGL